MRDEVIAVVLGGIFFILLLINIVADFSTRPGPTVTERPHVKTEIPVSETVCAEEAETYCRKYISRRILRE